MFSNFLSVKNTAYHSVHKICCVVFMVTICIYVPGKEKCLRFPFVLSVALWEKLLLLPCNGVLGYSPWNAHPTHGLFSVCMWRTLGCLSQRTHFKAYILPNTFCFSSSDILPLSNFYAPSDFLGQLCLSKANTAIWNQTVLTSQTSIIAASRSGDPPWLGKSRPNGWRGRAFTSPATQTASSVSAAIRLWRTGIVETRLCKGTRR